MWGQRLVNIEPSCMRVCLFVKRDHYHKICPRMEHGSGENTIKTVLNYLLFSLSTKSSYKHTLTLRDYLHKICGFLIIHEIIPLMLCCVFIRSLYLRMVSMGSLQTFNTNFWGWWFQILSTTTPHFLSPSEVRMIIIHRFLHNQYTHICRGEISHSTQLTGLITDLISIKREETLTRCQEASKSLRKFCDVYINFCLSSSSPQTSSTFHHPQLNEAKKVCENYE
jgi:hypothetical protein